MVIDIFSDQDNSHAARIESAISMINSVQHSFFLKHRGDGPNIKELSRIVPNEICHKIQRSENDPPFILITEKSFTDNWFSHEYRRASIITIFDWEAIFAPPSLKTYLMYQIAQSLIHFSADLSEEMALNIVHEPPVGCMFDMAAQKRDIKYGMVAGNLCPKCEGQMRTLGVVEEQLDAIRKILNVVRSEAIGFPVVIDSKYVFIIMRFTTNDENDNAWRHGIKTGVEESGLTAIRADQRVESGQILQKILNQIRKSRLVIAKIDENNLNVFFELGLSMGFDKDILLISESSLVLNLPSDLRNWECLTYEKGNYEQLSERVNKFLTERYHL